MKLIIKKVKIKRERERVRSEREGGREGERDKESFQWLGYFQVIH